MSILGVKNRRWLIKNVSLWALNNVAIDCIRMLHLTEKAGKEQDLASHDTGSDSAVIFLAQAKGPAFAEVVGCGTACNIVPVVLGFCWRCCFFLMWEEG